MKEKVQRLWSSEYRNRTQESRCKSSNRPTDSGLINHLDNIETELHLRNSVVIMYGSFTVVGEVGGRTKFDVHDFRR